VDREGINKLPGIRGGHGDGPSKNLLVEEKGTTRWFTTRWALTTFTIQKEKMQAKT
jgi:hypothetical protein